MAPKKKNSSMPAQRVSQAEETGTVPYDELMKGLSSLLKTGKYSDVTIHCSDHLFQVHRSIICPRSHFFSAACDSNFKEANEGTIYLIDDDLSAVEKLIQYMYELDYNDDSQFIAPRNETSKANPRYLIVDVPLWDDISKLAEAREQSPCEETEIPSPIDPAVSSGWSPSLLNARMYAIADKYGVSGLKILSKEKFQRSVQSSWNEIEFPIAIREVYDTTPEQDRGLRQVVTNVAFKNIQALKDKGDFKTVLKEVHGFTLDLFMEAINFTPSTCIHCGRNYGSDWQDRCPYCS